MQTRSRILRTAKRLFAQKGFDETTTRDLASAAGIAAGTLFNYFASKEAVAVTLVAETWEEAKEDCEERLQETKSAGEALFLFIVSGLRRLEPVRKYVGVVIETSLSPLAEQDVCEDGASLRTDHLQTVCEVLAHQGVSDEPGVVALHLYWTLYLGVLSFWSRDESPNQEDTLALVDQSMRLFVASLTPPTVKTEVNHDA